jgi:probable HAF family extracellular repeat protein
MSHWKSFGIGLFAAVCLLNEATGSANAQMYAEEWSSGQVINLGPGEALSINDAGQAVGIGPFGATEWSGGKAINLGGLPGSTDSEALSINDRGQVVGFSLIGGVEVATEWSGGSVINLGGLPTFANSTATAINNAGQVVGASNVGGVAYATEWSGTSIIDLGWAWPTQSTMRGRWWDRAKPAPSSGAAARLLT